MSDRFWANQFATSDKKLKSLIDGYEEIDECIEHTNDDAQIVIVNGKNQYNVTYFLSANQRHKLNRFICDLLETSSKGLKLQTTEMINEEKQKFGIAYVQKRKE